jgi:thymidine kinase
MVGYLEITFGPMFAGKSSALISRYRRMLKKEKKVLIVNNSQDNRYTDESLIVTHDNNTVPSIKVKNLAEIVECASNYDVILIDETNMFDDLFDTVNSTE